MIDLHTHILPKLDDGSQSVEQSEQMLRRAFDEGITLAVATPHFDAQRQAPEEFLRRRKEAFESLNLTKSMPKLLLGAEVAYFSGIGQTRQLRELCIGKSKLLLLEMPFRSWSQRIVDDVLLLRRRMGVIPVLAHIERYRKVPGVADYLSQMLSQGVLTQCNAKAITDWLLRRRSLQMLEAGEICFIGTDCHNMTTRPPEMRPAERRLRKHFGDQWLQQLCERQTALLREEA